MHGLGVCVCRVCDFPLSMLYPAMSLQEFPIFCWPKVRGDLLNESEFLYVDTGLEVPSDSGS